MDVNLKIPGLEKLVDYVASGIGSVAGPMLATWKARKEAQAKHVAALGDVEAQSILHEGDAERIRSIAKAQKDARKILALKDLSTSEQIGLQEKIGSWIQFQEEKRLRNIEMIVNRAAFELDSTNVLNSEPDHDWTARFFDYAQEVSSDELQVLWGRVLAGRWNGREVHRF